MSRAPGEAHVRVAVSLELPHRFGRYLLFDCVGQGGMAELYLARQATPLGGGKLFAVKLILPTFAERAELADMLIAEAKLAATLSHGNIVQVVDLGREKDRLFIAMEFVDGIDLASLLKRCSKEKVPLPPELRPPRGVRALRGARLREQEEHHPPRRLALQRARVVRWGGEALRLRDSRG